MNKNSSKPTIKAFEITGIKAATNNCLQKIITKHANNVAAVPNNTSINPIEDIRFAIAHPETNPII